MLLLALARPERIQGLVGIAAAPDFSEDLLLARATPDAAPAARSSRATGCSPRPMATSPIR